MSIESRSRQYGKVFDHWQIKEFLGSGSGGKTAVFRLQRSDSSWGACALKIVNLIEERGNVEALSDFRRREYEAAREECSRSAEQEVRLMDELRGNTNIVDYLDHTFVDGSGESGYGRDLLIQMELLEDLRSDLKNGRMFSQEEVLKIGRDICAALMLCHKKNILHRDVKPENIFRNKDGNYKLGDFGVSRVLDACPGAVASTGIGTYEYWPAEQTTGRYDKRVDLYSLGLVLYELSNGNRLPFAASTYATGKEVSLRLSGSALPTPSEAGPILAKVILKATAFKPEDRYQSAEEFLKALDWAGRKNVPLTENDVPEVVQKAVQMRLKKKRMQAHTSTKKSPPEIQQEKPDENSGISHVEEEPQRRGKRFPVVPALMLVLALALFAVAPSLWRAGRYIYAKDLLVREKYAQAAAVFESLGDYEDCAQYMEEARFAADYEAAETCFENGEYAEAVAAFEALGDYRDSVERMEEARLAADYEAAEDCLENGEYIQAIAAFEALGDYRNSAERMKEARLAADYEAAEKHFENGEYDEAIAAFTALEDYLDSSQRVKEAQSADEYAQVESLAQSGKVGEAAIAFYEMGEKERSLELWDEIAVRDTVSTESGTTVMLKKDGTVVFAGSNDYGEGNVENWENIIAVSMGYHHTVGLKADGTVVAAGSNDYGQCNVKDWKEIVSVSARYNHTIGLKADGTVVAAGSNSFGQCSVAGWRNIVAISAGWYHTVGLKADGRVVFTGSNGYGKDDIDGWRNIVAVSTKDSHIVGLKSDGTVVAKGSNDYGQCNVAGWRNIVAIGTGGNHTVGLKSDGTVVATGYNGSERCNVGEWTNIIAVSAVEYATIGFKSDGTIVKTGYGPSGLNGLTLSDLRLPNPVVTQEKGSGTASAAVGTYRTATVVDTDYVNVRSGPASFHPTTGTLKRGSLVQVYETQTNLGVDWARVDNGWVCMDYLRMNS